MANDLTTTDPKALAARWSEPQLGQSLEAMLATGAVWTSEDNLPLITDEECAEAERALAVYRAAPKGSPAAYVARQLGTLALALPTAKRSDAEEDARVQIYQRALADLDTDVLRAAVAEAIATCRFFPTVAELRALADRSPAPARLLRAFRLRCLIRRHHRGASAAAEPIVDAQELSDLRLRLGGHDEVTSTSAVAVPVPRFTLPRRLPSIEDYVGFGLTQEEAERAVAQRQEQEQNRRAA